MQLRKGVGSITNEGFSLGMFYNASPGMTRKAEVEARMKERHPSAWEDLEKIGKMKARGGDVFMINSRIPA